MSVKIVEVKSAKQFTQFIRLPHSLHHNEPFWMPTILADDRKFFSPKHNHQFNDCTTIMALALRDGKPVGRIMGILHHKYNLYRNERKARFGYLDCIDDTEVSHSLISFIENWAKQKDYHEIIGPYGFSDKDVQGLLIEGFDKMPLIDSACNPPYMVSLLEAEGYSKEVDCYTYKFPLSIEFPPVYEKVRQRYHTGTDFELLEFTKRSRLKHYIQPVLRLVNDTYNELYGFVPMNDIEIKELANRYLPVIDPRFVKVILHKEQVIAFIVALPNFSEGLVKSGGKLFPLGLYHILRAMKRTKQLDLMLGAVHRRFQGRGLELYMGMALFDSAVAHGFTDIEAHLILETNTRMRSEMERLGIPVDKRFRVFHKML